MAKCISFGLLSIQMLFPIINCIVFPFNYGWFIYVFNYYNESSYNFTTTNAVCIISVYFFTGIISLLLGKISDACWKSTTIVELKDANIQNKWLLYFSLIVCGILDMLGSLILTVDSLSKEIFISFSQSYAVIQLLFLMVLTKFFLKYPLYKHHLLSLILTVIGGFIIIVGRSVLHALEEKKESFKEFLFVLLCIVSSSILFSLSVVLQKYLMTKSGLSAYNALPFMCLGGFIMGLGTLVWQVGISQIVSVYLLAFSKGIVLYFILFLGTRIVVYIFSVLTLYYFNPPYYGSTDIILSIKTLIEDSILKAKGGIISSNILIFDIVIEGLGYLLATLGIVFYSEIIILHFCDFDKNTKKNVLERGEEGINSYIPLSEEAKKANDSKTPLAKYIMF